MTSLEEHLKKIAQSGGVARAKKSTKKQRQEWGKEGGYPKGRPRTKGLKQG